MKKEEFAQQIVDNMEIDNVIDTAVQGILDNWKQHPENLKEEIKQRQDILNGKKVE